MLRKKRQSGKIYKENRNRRQVKSNVSGSRQPKNKDQGGFGRSKKQMEPAGRIEPVSGLKKERRLTLTPGGPSEMHKILDGESQKKDYAQKKPTPIEDNR
jgi:hypothetical protein